VITTSVFPSGQGEFIGNGERENITAQELRRGFQKRRQLEKCKKIIPKS
jgi:hypothetical protein